MFLWLSRIILWLPMKLLRPTRVVGMKNWPKGKAIIASNHYSNWDIALFYLNIRKRLRIMAKKELFENKFMARIYRWLGAFPIDREGNDITAIKTSMKVLKDGEKLFVFPEGTRLKRQEDVLGELKSGMAMIAIKTQSPIVPVWITKKSKWFRMTKFIVGKPFELSEFYDKKLDEETLSQANQTVREKMLELREQELNRKKKR